MESTERDVCTAISNNKLQEPDKVGTSLQVLRDYLASHSADTAKQGGVEFLHFRKTAGMTDEYLVKFDLLRRKAEGRKQSGNTSPEAPGAKSRWF